MTLRFVVFIAPLLIVVLGNSAVLVAKSSQNSTVQDSNTAEYDVRRYSSFSEAVEGIGSNHASLFIPNVQTVSSSISVPSNITLHFIPGGRLIIPIGQTVDLKGLIQSTPVQIFSGKGRVAGLKDAYPEWFGAKGDGTTNDTIAFQTAIDSLSEGTIFIGNKNYLVSAIKLKGNMGIKGRGIQSSKITASGNGNIFSATDQSNIEISNIYFFGNNESFVDGDGQAISISANSNNQSNIKIHDNKFENFRGAGVVRVSGNNTTKTPTAFLSNVLVENNIFINNTDRIPSNGGVSSNAIYLVGGVTNFNVTKNFIDAKYQKLGISLFSNVNNGNVTNNTIQNNGLGNPGSVNSYGIMSYTLDGSDNYDITFSNNNIHNTRNMGIYLQSVRNHIVTGNTFDNCDIYSTDALLPAGAISVNIGHRISSSTLIISNNSIMNSVKEGIQISNRNGDSKVIVSGNNIVSTAGLMVAGIRVRDGSQNVIISGNYVTGTTSGGIDLTAAGGLISQIVVTGNIIEFCGYGILSAYGANGVHFLNISNNLVFKSAIHGIVLDYNSDVIVTGNVVTGSAKYGLSISNPSSRIKIIGNALSENGLGNVIDTSGSDTITYLENQSDLKQMPR